MDLLNRCTERWGKVELLDTTPALETHENVIYVPHVWGGAWGLFGEDGQALAGSVDLHGPESVPQYQILGWAGVAEGQAPEGLYVYGGVINPHYGHFLVNTLGRLWPLLDDRYASAKLIFHGPATVSAWFDIPFIRDIFVALGVAAERVVTFDAPTRINTVVVPHTSFREQQFIHRVYAALAHKIGATLLSGWKPRPGLPPAYLSKSRLVSGVGYVANEAEIEPALREGGIEIVYPETLSLRDQVAVFAERPAVLGTTGSGFHSSIFVPARAKLILVSPIPGPNTNFMLIDAVNGNDAAYYYAEGTQHAEGGGGPFITKFEFPEPERLADELLWILNETLSPEIAERSAVSHLRTDAGAVLGLRRNDGRLVLTAFGDPAALPVVAWRGGSMADAVFVLSPEPHRMVRWPGSGDGASVVSFRAVEAPDKRLMLQDPVGGGFLASGTDGDPTAVGVGPAHTAALFGTRALRSNARGSVIPLLAEWDTRPGGLSAVSPRDGMAYEADPLLAILRMLPLRQCLALGFSALARSYAHPPLLPLLRRAVRERSALLDRLAAGAAWGRRVFLRLSSQA